MGVGVEGWEVFLHIVGLGKTGDVRYFMIGRRFSVAELRISIPFIEAFFLSFFGLMVELTTISYMTVPQRWD